MKVSRTIRVHIRPDIDELLDLQLIYPALRGLLDVFKSLDKHCHKQVDQNQTHEDHVNRKIQVRYPRAAPLRHFAVLQVLLDGEIWFALEII